MDYTIKLLEIELTRLEKRLVDAQDYLENSIEDVTRYQTSVEQYAGLVYEMKTALDILRTSNSD